MMQCQICGNLDGPWEFSDDIKNMKTLLVCENCAKKLKKIRKKNKENDYTLFTNPLKGKKVEK